MRRDALNGGSRTHPASEGLTEKLAALADLDAVGLRVPKVEPLVGPI